MQTIRDILLRLEDGIARIGERVPEVLADPRAFPRESMMLLTLALLALALAALLVVAGVDLSRTWVARRRMGVRRDHRRMWRVVAVATLVGACVLGLVVLAPTTVVVSERCGSCHEIAEVVDAWKTGSHSEVSCYGCHASSGISGALVAATGGASRYFASVFASEAGSATVDLGASTIHSGRCASCHADISEGVVGEEIRMRHADVIDAGMQCTVCHPAVGHEALADSLLQIGRSVMSRCLVCHDGQRASADCVVCHDGRPSDTASLAPRGDTPAPVTCEGCHATETSERCVQCHGLVLPHPAPFFSEHAGLSWSDPGLCARCHEAARPTDGCGCHGDTNLHGTYSQWFPRHAVAAATNGMSSCNCHELNFCGMCHLESPF